MVCLVTEARKGLFYWRNMIKEIRLGLPKGSLNTPDRGDTRQVFIDAGYDIRGYESGKESDKDLAITNDPQIKPFITRPQSTAVELGEDMLDIAITGEDWIREGAVNGRRNGIRKIGDLEYGQTRLVLAVPETSNFTSLSDFFRGLKRGRPIRCFTEYLNLTSQQFMQNEVYQTLYGNVQPLVEIRGILQGENRLVRIIYSDGATEAYIRKGADIIADNTQSGTSLRESRLREIGEIMKSSVGLYAGPSCTGWKERKAEEIFEQLQGAIVGKRYFDLKFNIPLSEAATTRRYLVEEGLCADEPTMIPMTKFAAVNILILRNRFPTILQALRNLGASAIVRSEVKQFIP